MTSKEHLFLAYFDCLGFECIVDITSYERHKLLADINGTDIRSPVNLNAMMLRARFNPQRNPEIYVFTSDLSEATLIEFAEENPQALADLIRSHGKCLWKTPAQEGVIK